MEKAKRLRLSMKGTENNQSVEIMELDRGMDNLIQNCKYRNLSKYTIEHYEQIIHIIYKHIDSKTLICLIDENTVNEFVLFCKSRGLRTILYFFMRTGYVRTFNIKMIKAAKEPIVCYNSSEIDTLLRKPNINKCTFLEYRNFVIINFLLGTGARLSTVVNVKDVDIDLDNELI